MSGGKDLDNPYLFKQVSLLSTSDVRYDGILYIIDYDANTLALQHVRCMGTEGRRSGEQAIAPSDSTYEFIIFRADNIKKVYVVDDNRYADITGEILEPLRSKPSYNPDSYVGHSHSSYSPNYPSPPLPSGPRSSRNGGGIPAGGNHMDGDNDDIPMGYSSMMGNSSHLHSHSQGKTHGGQRGMEDEMYVSPHMGYRSNDEQAPKRKVGVQGPKYVGSIASGDRADMGRRNYGYPNPEPRSYNYEQSRGGFRPPMGPRSNVHGDYRNDNRYDYRNQNNVYHENYPPRRPQNMGRGPPMDMRREYYGPQAQGRQQNYNPNYRQRAPLPQYANAYRAPAQPRTAQRPQTGNVRAGTGEYLEHRRLIGNEIEIPKEDLPLEQFEKLNLNTENENEEKKETKETEQIKGNSEVAEKNETGDKDATTTNEKQEGSKEKSKQAQDTVTLTHGKIAYDKTNFFDDLNLDSNKERGEERSKNRPLPEKVREVSEDQEDKRHLDAETFGSVAEQYRMASGVRRGGGGGGLRYNRGVQNTAPNYYQRDNGQARYGGNRSNYNNRYYERQPQFQRPSWQPRQ